MTEALLPELDNKVFKTIEEIEKSRPKGEAEKREGAIASNAGFVGWEKGLKPYIKKRIESLEKMLEVNLDGKESISEIGLRYVICSSLAKELQDIINRVSLLDRIVTEKRKKEKHDSKTKK